MPKTVLGGHILLPGGDRHGELEDGPWGDAGDTQRRPPWALMIERQIESPMPMPLGFVVKKASNKRSMISGAIPGPESSTAISTAAGPVALRSHAQHPRFVRARAHRLNGVHDQIQDDLLQLDPVPHDRSQPVG